jgi:hypothetical protein
MAHDRLFFQVAGNFSVTSDVPEVVALLGACAEPLPTLQPVAIMTSDARLPDGTIVFRYPSQASLAATLLGLELPEAGQDGEPLIVGPTREPPPETITATQLRLWLFRRGIGDSQVIAAIQSIPGEAVRGEALIQWSHSPYFERLHPLVQAVAAWLGIDIDEAFAEASSL